MSLFYEVNFGKLHALVEEEVAKVADEAYAEGGQSLYDSIILTQKDWSTVDRLIDDAVNSFASKQDTICVYSPEERTVDGKTVTVPRLEFDLPDIDMSRWPAAVVELNRYVSLFVCASLFQERAVSKEPEYTSRSQAAIITAVTLLKTRKKSSAYNPTVLETTKNKVTEINQDSDDNHYPSAKSVYAAIQAAGYVNAASYNADTKRIELKHGNVVIAEVDAAAFVIDGMVSSVSVTGGNLIITFNTDAGKEDIEIPISSFFDASQYYDKSSVDSLLAGKIGGVKVNGTELEKDANKKVNIQLKTINNLSLVGTGNLDTQNVLVAKNGITRWNEVCDAYSSGKAVFVKKNTEIWWLSNLSYNYIPYDGIYESVYATFISAANDNKIKIYHIEDGSFSVGYTVFIGSGIVYDFELYMTFADGRELLSEVSDMISDAINAIPIASQSEIDSLFQGGGGGTSSSDGGGSGSGPATIPDDTNGGNWVQVLGQPEHSGDCRHGSDIGHYDNVTAQTWFFDYDGNRLTVAGGPHYDGDAQTVAVYFDGWIDGIEINSSVSHYSIY